MRLVCDCEAGRTKRLCHAGPLLRSSCPWPSMLTMHPRAVSGRRVQYSMISSVNYSVKMSIGTRFHQSGGEQEIAHDRGVYTKTSAVSSSLPKKTISGRQWCCCSCRRLHETTAWRVTRPRENARFSFETEAGQQLRLAAVTVNVGNA